MKIILIVGLLSFIASSCSLFGDGRFSGDIVKDKREIENVTKVRIGYGFDVHLVIGDEESLIIQAPQDALEYIYSEVDGSKLEVKLDSDVRPSELSVKKIDLMVKSIDEIRISGTTTLNCDNVIFADTISIGTSGTSEVKLSVNSEEIQIESSGASKVTIQGETEFLDIQGISGESLFNGFGFITGVTSVFASGKSTVKTHPKEKLEVAASGRSRILYKGNPVVESHLSGEACVKNYNY